MIMEGFYSPDKFVTCDQENEYPPFEDDRTGLNQFEKYL